MSLETIIQVLEHAMKGELEKVGPKILEKRDVQNTLTTFFAEQQTRPELVSQIRSQSLMYEYLQLSLEEREKLESFRNNYLDYIKGNGKDLRGNLKYSPYGRKVIQIAKKQRYIEQLLNLFDFYLENRDEGEFFSSNYLQVNKKIKDKFGTFGSNFIGNVRRNFKQDGGFNYLIKLVSEIEPNIKKHSTFKEVLKIDGPRQLVRMFDFYLENRDKEIFNNNYLRTNKRLNKRFGNQGTKLFHNAKNNLRENGGIKYLVEIAAKERPEILDYWTHKNIPGKYNDADIIGWLDKIFDFFLRDRFKGEIFNVNYIIKNQRLLEEFGNRGKNLYGISKKRFRKNGGINYLIQLASKERPEILDYWDYNKQKASARKGRVFK